jgi:hypothetical protein
MTEHNTINFSMMIMNEWIKRMGKTAYEICNNIDRDRIKLNEQHTGFTMESNDAVLGCIGWAIEQHINSIPSSLKPTFQKILDDIQDRKEISERS